MKEEKNRGFLDMGIPRASKPEEEPTEKISGEGQPGEEESIKEPVDPNQTMFEGGPTMGEIADWKEKHPKGVFFSVFGNETYIWRVMQRAEYKAIINNRDLTTMDREEEITVLIMLYPRNLTVEKLQTDKAGVPSLMFEMAMDKSGFTANSAPIKL